jgi:hypothetical protein
MNNIQLTLNKLTEAMDSGFKKALDEFCRSIDEFIKKETTGMEKWEAAAGRPYVLPLTYTDGGKFVKVLLDSGNSKAAYCFVEKATGDVYKAASFKAPAKNHSRANIYNEDSYKSKLTKNSTIKYSFT